MLRSNASFVFLTWLFSEGRVASPTNPAFGFESTFWLLILVTLQAGSEQTETSLLELSMANEG
jgi:hypothetical protein